MYALPTVSIGYLIEVGLGRVTQCSVERIEGQSVIITFLDDEEVSGYYDISRHNGADTHHCLRQLSEKKINKIALLSGI